MFRKPQSKLNLNVIETFANGPLKIPLQRELIPARKVKRRMDWVCPRMSPFEGADGMCYIEDVNKFDYGYDLNGGRKYASN